MPDASAADAPVSDAPVSDAPMLQEAAAADAADAGSCQGLISPGIGPLNLTLDQETAYLCSTGLSGLTGVSGATKACDGLLAILATHGADGKYLYLFDPTTRQLVEALAADVGDYSCVQSATGVDLTASPGFAGCWPSGGFPYQGGGFGFQGLCVDGAAWLDASAE